VLVDLDERAAPGLDGGPRDAGLPRLVGLGLVGVHAQLQQRGDDLGEGVGGHEVGQ
jgi:hypothetical protein